VSSLKSWWPGGHALISSAGFRFELNIRSHRANRGSIAIEQAVAPPPVNASDWRINGRFACDQAAEARQKAVIIYAELVMPSLTRSN
jgi:hypothetical protein